MKLVLSRIMFLMGLVSLAACGQAPNDPGPGGVTVGEAKALDEAAEMLDERNAPPEEEDVSPAGSSGPSD